MLFFSVFLQIQLINFIQELPSLIQCVQNINIKNSSKSGFVFVGTKFDLGIIMSPSDKNQY